MGEILIKRGMVNIKAAALRESLSLVLVTLSIGVVVAGLLYMVLEYSDVDISAEIGSDGLVSVIETLG